MCDTWRSRRAANTSSFKFDRGAIHAAVLCCLIFEYVVIFFSRTAYQEANKYLYTANSLDFLSTKQTTEGKFDNNKKGKL